jgi:hypothetical protein
MATIMEINPVSLLKRTQRIPAKIGGFPAMAVWHIHLLFFMTDVRQKCATSLDFSRRRKTSDSLDSNHWPLMAR